MGRLSFLEMKRKIRKSPDVVTLEKEYLRRLLL